MAGWQPRTACSKAAMFQPRLCASSAADGTNLIASARVWLDNVFRQHRCQEKARSLLVKTATKNVP